ncbi:MAG: DUF1566 domain-containing protein [Hydrogenophaga sp.]|nr:DUF1566 domain-containing protein [Hydrogenophaga sp.]
MSAITVDVELQLTPRSQAIMAALYRSLDPRFVADEPVSTAPAAPAAIPAIGAPWPGIENSVYAGISRGEAGAPDAHLVLLAEQPGALDWDSAMKLSEGRTDGARMPTRFESALMYAHVREHFDTSKWHWTSTQYSENHAWSQGFGYGDQLSDGKEFEGRVRLVRRLPL